MKKTVLAVLALTLIAGCTSSNVAFTKKELSVINNYKTVVQTLPDKHKEPLKVYSRDDKVGTEMAGVVFGLLTGSFGYHSGGKTPRTRFENEGGVLEAMKSSARKSVAEEITLLTPTEEIHKILASRFQTVAAEKEALKDELTITVKPVVWHLYYDKLLDKKQAFFLEYAGDVTLSLPIEKITRYFACDKQSQHPLTKEDWLANDALRVREFVNRVAEECTTQIFTELGEK